MPKSMGSGDQHGCNKLDFALVSNPLESKKLLGTTPVSPVFTMCHVAISKDARLRSGGKNTDLE